MVSQVLAGTRNGPRVVLGGGRGAGPSVEIPDQLSVPPLLVPAGAADHGGRPRRRAFSQWRTSRSISWTSAPDIAGPLAPETVRQLKDALHRYKVIFFRDQRLDHASQIAFGRQFGTLTHAHPHDEAPPDGYAEIFTVDPRRYDQRYGQDYRKLVRRRQYSYFTGWHTDVTAAVNPPAVSILRADVVPDIGGDTQWTSLQAAYEGLSPAVQAFADGLRAEHRYAGPDSGLSRDTSYAKRIEDSLLVAIHPVVRVHPVTGAKGLFVNPGFTSHIVDVSPRESRAILDLLYAEITRPEYTVRFRWSAGERGGVG